MVLLRSLWEFPINKKIILMVMNVYGFIYRSVGAPPAASVSVLITPDIKMEMEKWVQFLCVTQVHLQLYEQPFNNTSANALRLCYS